MGFEPTPFRNRALIYRLRPLGHSYFTEIFRSFFILKHLLLIILSPLFIFYLVLKDQINLNPKYKSKLTLSIILIINELLGKIKWEGWLQKDHPPRKARPSKRLSLDKLIVFDWQRIKNPQQRSHQWSVKKSLIDDSIFAFNFNAENIKHRDLQRFIRVGTVNVETCSRQSVDSHNFSRCTGNWFML